MSSPKGSTEQPELAAPPPAAPQAPADVHIHNFTYDHVSLASRATCPCSKESYATRDISIWFLTCITSFEIPLM